MDGWIDVGISFIFGLWTYLEVGGSCFVYHILTFLIHLFICVCVCIVWMMEFMQWACQFTAVES